MACSPEGLFHEAPQQSTLMHSLQAKPVLAVHGFPVILLLYFLPRGRPKASFLCPVFPPPLADVRGRSSSRS
jgi:hypothetical protein